MARIWFTPAPYYREAVGAAPDAGDGWSAGDLRLADTNFDGLLPLVEIEEMRPSASVVGDAAFGVYQVQSLGRGAVSFVYGVVHLFDEDGQGDVQIQATGLSHFFPLAVALVLPEQDAFGNVAIGLAAVNGMGFLNVHYEKFDLLGKPAADLFDTLNLSAERGSSVAAKNQPHRAVSLKAGQTDPLFGPHELKLEVGRLFSNHWAHFVPRDHGVQSLLYPGGQAAFAWLQHLSCGELAGGGRFPLGADLPDEVAINGVLFFS